MLVILAFGFGVVLGALLENCMMLEMLRANACWKDNVWTDEFTGWVKINK